MSGGMVPLPVLPVKAPSPKSCPSPSKSFGCHTSGKSLQSSALLNATVPATPLDSISKYANSFGICTSKHTSKSTAINPFESMPLSPKLFPCHTSVKCARNSFPCHTSKITIPQALCLPHIRDPQGEDAVVVDQPSPTGPRLPHRGINRIHSAASFPCFKPFQPSESAERFLRPEASHLEKPALLYWNLSVGSRTVTKLRISIVQYLNTAPLVWGFTNGPLRGKYDLSFTVPSQCAEELRTGKADVAIIPAIEYQRIEDLVILPDMAIAKKPIERVQSFALDRSSRSTQTLTRILCAEKWKIAPQFFEAPPDLNAMLGQADAALLIGDPALRIAVGIEKESRHSAKGQTVCQAATLGISGPELLYVYDVVGEWRGLTGLPAVLAVWAARRDVATPEVTADFLASRDFGLSRIPEICFDAAGELELPRPALESYLRENIDFSLDEENHHGLELYFAHAAKLGLIPRAKPIKWAATRAEAVEL